MSTDRGYLIHRLTRVLSDAKDMNMEYADLHHDFLNDVLRALSEQEGKPSEERFSRWYHGVEGECLGYKHLNGSYDDEATEQAARSAWLAATPEPTQARASDAEDAWQPIETAPKGRHHHIMLAYAADEIYLGGFVSQGYWLEMDDDAPDNMGHDGGFVDVHFDFFKCARSFGNPAYQSKGLQPTHWMPIPKPPAALQGATPASKEAK